jgi:hypothetical protein
MNIQTIIDYESIEWDGLSVWGDIYLKHGNWCYPADGWNDLVCLVLYMWMYRLIEFLKNYQNSSTCTFWFADGNYSFEIGKCMDSSMYKIEFHPQSDDLDNLPERIDLPLFIKEIMDVVKILKLKNPGIRRMSDFDNMIEQFDILTKLVNDINF